jgi:hypothetical protein
MNTLLTLRSGKDPVYTDIRFSHRDYGRRGGWKSSRGRVIILLLILALSFPAVCARSDGGLRIEVSDAGTGSGIDGAAVYTDGGYSGVTSEGEGAGIIIIPDISDGSHTVRVTDAGYLTVSETITYPGESPVRIVMARDHLVALNPENPGSRGISIVFIPSSTYYRTSDNTKVGTNVYVGNETRFREDVIRVINRTFGNLDQVTAPSVSLPLNFRDRFTFYYYFDPANSADAFSGCAGKVPDQFWNSVTFSDLTIILYPHYDGWYTNASSQPVGCFEDSGTGHRQMKVPSDRDFLVYHEIGHGLFGLVDTYCGETDYFENDPYPNVWSSEAACRAGAVTDHRDPLGCRRIQQESSDADSCSKDFWRWDPDPDIMKTSSSGMFGAASTERISYILTMSAEG